MPKPSTLPDPIATDANYDFEVWPPGHPNAGDPTPWSGQPTKDGLAEAAFAAKGAIPARRLPATAYNSRGSKIDALLAFLFAATPTKANNELVLRDANGDVDLAGARLREGPWERYSHEEADTWQESFRFVARTFCASGVFPFATFDVFDMTRPNSASDHRYFFADFPTYCVVIMHFDTIIWAGDGFLLSDELGFHARRATFGFQKDGAVWSGGGTLSTADDIDTGLGMSGFPSILGGDTSRVKYRLIFDPGLSGFEYRIVCHTSIRVLELDG